MKGKSLVFALATALFLAGMAPVAHAQLNQRNVPVQITIQAITILLVTDFNDFDPNDTTCYAQNSADYTVDWTIDSTVWNNFDTNQDGIASFPVGEGSSDNTANCHAVRMVILTNRSWTLNVRASGDLSCSKAPSTTLAISKLAFNDDNTNGTWTSLSTTDQAAATGTRGVRTVNVDYQFTYDLTNDPDCNGGSWQGTTIYTLVAM